MKKMRRNDKCGSVSLQMKNQAGNYSDQEKKFKEGKFCVLSMKQPVQVSQRERERHWNWISCCNTDFRELQPFKWQSL